MHRVPLTLGASLAVGFIIALGWAGISPAAEAVGNNDHESRHDRQEPANAAAGTAGEDIGQPSRDAAAAKDPLVQVAQVMQRARERIAQGQVGAETQSLQQDAIDALDRLLQQAQTDARGGKQPRPNPSDGNPLAGKSSAGGGAEPGQAARSPAARSTDRLGNGGGAGEGAGRPTEALLRRPWGELPDKVRQVIASAVGEKFLPQYRREIEDYFRRLAKDDPSRP